jgi:hypothetical protein
MLNTILRSGFEQFCVNCVERAEWQKVRFGLSNRQKVAFGAQLNF